MLDAATVKTYLTTSVKANGAKNAFKESDLYSKHIWCLKILLNR